MRKKFLSIFILILCYILIFPTLFSCDKTPQSDSSVYAPGGEPQSFNSTDISLVKNGQSDYVIVVPSKSTNVLNYAASELQLFLEQSTGCCLNIISDNGLINDNTKKYLSIGPTTLLKGQTDIIVDENEIGEAGMTITRKGNTVYIAGPEDYGTLYSVYKFLFFEINFVAYASDCVVFDYYSDLKVKDFNYKWKPTFTFAAGLEEDMERGKTEAFRMYNAWSGESVNGGFGIDGDLYNGLFCHTLPWFVSKEKYPELYEDGDQLCFTSPRALELCIESAVKYARNANEPFIQIGINDHRGFCHCDECTRQSLLYGGIAGTYVRFLNAVAEAVEEALLAEGIEKELTILGLMYVTYSYAPVQVGADGNYEPVPVDANDEKVLYHTNMMREGQISAGCMYTTFDCCFYHPLSDDTVCETNKLFAEEIKKWGVLTKNINYFHYGVDFSAFTYHFNTWTHSAETFKFMHQFDGQIYTEESCHENGITSMGYMRSFIRGQQMINPYADTKKLINDFITNYYGPGAEAFREYFFSMMENYEKMFYLQGDECMGIFHHIRKDGFWTRENFTHYKQLLKQAMYDCEMSGLDNADIYKERIYREYFLILVNDFTTYSAYYSPEEREAVEKEVIAGREKYDVYN